MANLRPVPPSLAALADPTRRAIFERVARRPAPVGEIAAALPVSRPAVSQHLKILGSAGLVTCERDGTRHLYRLDPRGIGALRDWLDQFWTETLSGFADFVAKEEPPK
ncbi:MAG TPA: metalloregulator ArsR/SmtB family transcription factor [Paracoccaceae bacterium]|nr:metalloregulator ArsR/SmtB family transcription factor [Paracoccaceae bacterium]